VDMSLLVFSHVLPPGDIGGRGVTAGEAAWRGADEEQGE
jgi:hypothetical protein